MILIVMGLTGHASLYPLLGRTILAALLEGVERPVRRVRGSPPLAGVPARERITGIRRVGAIAQLDRLDRPH